MSRLSSKITHNMMVPTARPWVNKLGKGARGSSGAAVIDGAMEASIFNRLRTVSSADLSTRFARNRTDSGKAIATIGIRMTGTMPPTQNTLVQPSLGMRTDDARPPTTAPSGNPQNIRPTVAARRFSGAYSPVNETTDGNAAPRPRPVRNRTSVRDNAVVV